MQCATLSNALCNICCQMIVSGGLDKKLYIYDPGVKKPVYCVPYEAPFASLAFRDDGNTLAAGTNSGRVVFYDVRGRPQPFTILRAYSASEVRRDGADTKLYGTGFIIEKWVWCFS
jgi:WD40 repeat protein